MEAGKSVVDVSFKPTLNHLNELESWLREERKMKNEGFYCNWNVISSSFDRKSLGVISVDSVPIGFITWSKTSKLSVNIPILEIHPEFRNQGFAECLVSNFIELMRFKRIVAIDLECEPQSSIGFWKKIGFVEAPGNISRWQYGSKHMYKVLKHTFEANNPLRYDEVIELWDEEPHMATNKLPKWQWELAYTKSGRLKTSIVHPCERDWRICWKKGDKILIDNKLKRFGRSEIDFGPFMVITKRPTI